MGVGWISSRGGGQQWIFPRGGQKWLNFELPYTHISLSNTMRFSNTVLFCAHYTMIAGTLVLKGFTADSNHIHKFPQREVSVDQPLWLSSLCLFQEKTLRNSGSKRWRTFESNTQGRIVLRKLTVRPSGQFYLVSQVS